MPSSIHKAIGAIIVKENNILMIDRATFPKGLAFPAGHLEEGESPSQALIRELKEETNLDVINYRLIGEEIIEKTPCNKKSSVHHWFIYSCEVKGEIKKNEEANSIIWVDIDKLKELKIDQTWRYWLKKLNYI